MVWTAPTEVDQTVSQLVDKIISLGEMSRKEHLHLTSVILSDYKLTDAERRQINRAFDYIQTGRLKLVD